MLNPSRWRRMKKLLVNVRHHALMCKSERQIMAKGNRGGHVCRHCPLLPVHEQPVQILRVLNAALCTQAKL